MEDLTDSVNSMAGNLTAQVRNVPRSRPPLRRSFEAITVDVEILG